MRPTPRFSRTRSTTVPTNKFDAQFLYSKEYLNDEKVNVGS